MAEKKDLKSLLKKVDIGDTRVLVVGVILLIIPILFMLFVVNRPGQKRASSGAHDRLGMHKKAFSFQRKSQHPAGKMASAASARKVLPPEQEWSDMVERISRSRAYIPPQIAAMPKEKRQYYEAEMNTEIRTANMLISQEKFDEAKAICEQILRTEDENNFLRFMASGNLCDIYNATGDVAALKKEFLRYLDLMEKLNLKGFETKNVKAGYLAMNRLILDFEKIKSNSEMRSQISETIAKNKRPGTELSTDEAMEHAFKYWKNFPADMR